MKFRFLMLAAIFMFAASTMTSAQSAPKKPSTTPAAKIESFFKASGLQYKRAGADVWGVVREGVQYFYAVEDDIFVAGVILATREGRNNSCQLLETLLKLNHRFDQVKVVIDDDGDIAVRADAPVGGLDLKRFNGMLKQHHLATGQIYEEVKALL